MNEKEFLERFQYDSEKDLLGSGGFGAVYKALDTVKNKYVAIKISQVKDIFGKFTLLNEVKLSESIDDHTNVARYEFGLRIKKPFLADYAVMAYYEEGNLDMVIRQKHGILDPQEQYEIIEGLLQGIAHLHNENIIHRDLKPANVLMLRTKQGQWRPKIADFGLSRQMEDYDASMANSAIGITTAYAAPEQIQNKPIKKNVDLWALGVIIYKLFTGEMPFAAAQSSNSTTATMEISRKITQLEIPENLNTIPEPYQTIVRRCWIKDTGDRAQSANELLDILKGRSTRQFRSSSTTTTTSSTTTGYTRATPSTPRTVPVVPEVENAETVLFTDTPSVETQSDATEIAPMPLTPFVNDYNIAPESDDATQIMHNEPEEEQKRNIPIWIWAVLGAIVLLGIAFAMGLFSSKEPTVAPDPCNIEASPNLDCDGDGVLNKDDKCPKDKGDGKDGCKAAASTSPTPVPKPAPANTQKDSDGDGIPDADDKCPTIKGTKAGLGCY